MLEFVDQQGHCKVGTTFMTADGVNLRRWVAQQRKTKDQMSFERIAKLEALPGWSWNVFSDQWEESFQSLSEFVKREGHCIVTKNHKEENGSNLGLWVSNQRRARDTMSVDRKNRLEALVGWTWPEKKID